MSPSVIELPSNKEGMTRTWVYMVINIEGPKLMRK
jgi:hypothetical protein